MRRGYASGQGGRVVRPVSRLGSCVKAVLWHKRENGQCGESNKSDALVGRRE